MTRQLSQQLVSTGTARTRRQASGTAEVNTRLHLA